MKMSGGCDTPWMLLPPGKRLLTQWLIHCRYPPRESSPGILSSSGEGYVTDTGGLQTKDQSNENNLCHSLEATVNPNKVVGSSNQLHLVDLAFQPEVSSWPGHDLFFACMMSSCVAGLLVGDRWLYVRIPAWCKLTAV